MQALYGYAQVSYGCAVRSAVWGSRASGTLRVYHFPHSAEGAGRAASAHSGIEGVLRVWLTKQAAPPDVVSVSNAAELEEKYGAIVRPLAAIHASSYKLSRAMLGATPPLLG